MAQYTRDAIIEYTMELAKTRPLRRITVRDIVDGCGITRNTFYYYFHDVLDVVDGVVTSKLLEVSEENDSDKAMGDLIEFVMSNKKMWRNIYLSLDRDEFTGFINEKIHIMIMDFLAKSGNNISKSDAKLICTFYEEALSGVLVRWVKNDIEINTAREMRETASRIQYLFINTMHDIAKKASELPDAAHRRPSGEGGGNG